VRFLFASQQSSRSQRLQLQVSAISWNGKDAEGVGVAEATFPALNSNDRSARFNDIESQRVAQAKSDAVIDLIVSQTLENLPGK